MANNKKESKGKGDRSIILDENNQWEALMKTPRETNEIVDKAINNPGLLGERAIQILLAPNVDSLPFTVNMAEEDKLINYSFIPEQWVYRLSPEKRKYVAGLIGIYVGQAEMLLNETSEETDEWHFYEQALEAYNWLILVLLPVLDEEDAAKVFKSFKINDPVPYKDEDIFSGYKPLASLLKNEFDLRWKEEAIGQVHKVIEAEISDGAEPRVEWEEAFRAYGRILGELALVMSGSSRERQRGISQEIFEREVLFMMRVNPDTPIFESWQIQYVLHLISPEAGNQLMRAQVLTQKESDLKYEVRDTQEEWMAEELLKREGLDSEVAGRLTILLEQYRNNKANKPVRYRGQ